MWILVRFVEVKIEYGLTLFLICFSKKKTIKYGLTCFFFYVICIRVNKMWKNV